MRPLLAFASLTVLAVRAQAAGGHFDVDDAAVLDPARCQVEAWAQRLPALPATLGHLGSACRVGPVELGANLERRTSDGSSHLVGPQLKWVVDPIVGTLSTGIAWSAFYDLTNGGRAAQTLYVPFTWRAAGTLWLHANIGLDRDPEGTRWRRQGASVEWAAGERWSFIAERVKIVGTWTSRAGARVRLGEMTSLDVSAARTGPGGDRVYAVGLNQEFAR